MKSLVTQYNLDDYVTFTGRRNDVADILNGMDVFIMPSLVEGLPMSAIEAMRAGLYLILTDMEVTLNYVLKVVALSVPGNQKM